MENSTNLKEIILSVANKEKFSSLLLEKDYYLTLFLLELSKKPIDHLVFKGGTCLNKCYLGFFRLSEDLDFIYNQDTTKLTNRQMKLKTEEIRSEIKNFLVNCGLLVGDKLGVDWQKITHQSRVLNLVVFARYRSLFTENLETIKIEVSFRNQLYYPVEKRRVAHLFYNKLGEPILKTEANVVCISLFENLAEKYRAIITRKSVALRDVFDIGYISKLKRIKPDTKLINLILKKIHETRKMTKEEFFNNISLLDVRNLNIAPLEVVLRSDLDTYSELDFALEKVKRIVV